MIGCRERRPRLSSEAPIALLPFLLQLGRDASAGSARPWRAGGTVLQGADAVGECALAIGNRAPELVAAAVGGRSCPVGDMGAGGVA